jgi:hypothetical protein
MNIKKLAQQAKIEGVAGHIRALERFARLAYAAGAAAEREECAKLFDERDNGLGFYEPHEPAEIIRERGKA